MEIYRYPLFFLKFCRRGGGYPWRYPLIELLERLITHSKKMASPKDLNSHFVQEGFNFDLANCYSGERDFFFFSKIVFFRTLGKIFTQIFFSHTFFPFFFLVFFEQIFFKYPFTLQKLSFTIFRKSK